MDEQLEKVRQALLAARRPVTRNSNIARSTEIAIAQRQARALQILSEAMSRVRMSVVGASVAELAEHYGISRQGLQDTISGREREGRRPGILRDNFIADPVFGFIPMIHAEGTIDLLDAVRAPAVAYYTQEDMDQITSIVNDLGMRPEEFLEALDVLLGRSRWKSKD